VVADYSISLEHIMANADKLSDELEGKVDA
jgi:hypothetical protein